MLMVQCYKRIDGVDVKIDSEYLKFQLSTLDLACVSACLLHYL